MRLGILGSLAHLLHLVRLVRRLPPETPESLDGHAALGFPAIQQKPRWEDPQRLLLHIEVLNIDIVRANLKNLYRNFRVLVDSRHRVTSESR